VDAIHGKLDPRELAAGRIEAVASGRAVAVTSEGLAAQASGDAVFVERARQAAQVARVPTALVRPEWREASATLLSQEVVVPNASEGTAVRARAYVRDNSGLMFSGANNDYRGTLIVALASDQPAPAAPRLARPVSLFVLARGAAVEPSPVQVSELETWYPVRLVVPRAVAPYRVAVSASPNVPGDEVEMAVQSPTVALVPDTPRIPGWGLGKVSIAVDASNVTDADGATVLLETNRGQVESGGAKLDPRGKGIAVLRSVGQGVARVQVAEPYVGQPIDIEFAAPWAFLLLAGLGGLAGAFVQQRGRQRWPRALGIGVVTAIIMTVAYAVGLDWVVKVTGWTTLANAGEAVVFVLGALGALVGVRVLTPG
jgi:hypothetical protein